MTFSRATMYPETFEKLCEFCQPQFPESHRSGGKPASNVKEMVSITATQESYGNYLTNLIGQLLVFGVRSIFDGIVGKRATSILKMAYN